MFLLAAWNSVLSSKPFFYILCKKSLQNKKLCGKIYQLLKNGK